MATNTLQTPAQIASSLRGLQTAMRYQPWTVSESWRNDYDAVVSQLIAQYEALKATDRRLASQYLRQVQTLNTYTLPYLRRFWESYQQSVKRGEINPEDEAQAKLAWGQKQQARITGEAQKWWETTGAYQQGMVQVGDQFYHKDFWDSLTPRQQGLLGAQGADAFNKATQEATQALAPWTRNGQIDITTAAAQNNPDIDRALMFVGVSDTDIAQARAGVQGSVKLPDGQYIRKDEFDKLPKYQQELLLAKGLQGIDDYYAEMKREMAKPGADVFAIAKKYLHITGPAAGMDVTQATKELEQLYAAVVANAPDEHPMVLRAAANLYAADPKLYGDYKEAFDFVNQNTQLKSGEWVEKVSYDAMPKDEQNRLNELGLDKYNAWVDEQVKIYQKEKAEFDEWLKGQPEEVQKNIADLGVDNYIRWYEENTIQVQDGKGGTVNIPKDDFERMPVEVQKALMNPKLGYGILEKLPSMSPVIQFYWMQKLGLVPDKTQFAGTYTLKPGDEGYVPDKYRGLGYKRQVVVPAYQYDLSQFQYPEKAPEGYKWVETGVALLGPSPVPGAGPFYPITPALLSYIRTHKIPIPVKTQRELVATDAEDSATQYWKAMGNMYATLVYQQAPIAYTVTDWENMPNWERALSIAGDVVSIVPGVGVALRSAATARRAGMPIIRAIATGAKIAALAEIRAPVTMLTRPGAGIKTMLDPVETALRYKKIPYEVLETSFHTIRLPVSKVGTKNAVELRNALMTNLRMGKKPTAIIDGVEARMPQAVLNRVVDRVAVHSTPDVRPFMTADDVVVKAGREGGLYFAPSMHGRFTLASAFGDMPEGGIPGILLIRDEKLLSRMIQNAKVYKGAAEFESLLKAGEHLGKPVQQLITRDLSGRKLLVLVYGEKFTPDEIAKLKFLGAPEVMRQLFARNLTQPKLRYTTLWGQAQKATKAVKKLEGQLATAKKAKDVKAVARVEKQLQSASTKLERAERDLRRAIQRPYAGAMLGITTGVGAVRTALRETARTDSVGLARQLRGMDRTQRERVLSYLEPRQRQSIRREIRRPDTRRVQIARADVRVAGMTRIPRAVGRPSIARTPTITRVDKTRTPSIIRTPVIPGTPKTPRVPKVPRIPDILRIPRIPEIPKITKGKVTPEQEKQLAATKGVVGWKQGLFYIYWKPPYRQADMVYSRNPIEGIPQLEGRTSAIRSVRKLQRKGKLPEKIGYDMGIMDVQIVTPRSGEGKPQLKYKRDVKQKTQITGVMAGAK